jgi:hypothetical protein
MKIRNVIMAAGLLAVGATLFGVGCGGTPGVTCSITETIGTTKITECSTIDPKSGNDVSSDDLAKVCTAEMGKVVDSCPTAGLVGSCTYSDASYDYTLNFYSGTASVDEMTCKTALKGTWKAK